MIKSASWSGAVAALSRACHTFERGPMMSLLFLWIFSSIVSKGHTDVWLFSFRRWDINSSSFFTSVILADTRFSVKIDSFKSCSFTYWLKCELAYFAKSSGRTHLNRSSSFKMINLFEGYWLSIFSDLPPSLPCVGKLRVFFLGCFLFILTPFVAIWARQRRTTTKRSGSSFVSFVLLAKFFWFCWIGSVLFTW